MIIILYILAVALFVGFLLIVFRGAPYVPTHKNRAIRALDLLDLPKNATIVDLGSGDGVVLQLAAIRGLRAVGYELNPFLCILSWWRCRRFGQRVQVRWRDFWLTPIPTETDAIFIFLAGPYMKKLQRKVVAEMQQRTKPLMVVSYGFEIPGFAAQRHDGDLHVYKMAAGVSVGESL